ncbi:hypothetical protein HDU86_004265 [Geranomyces michiganensis]|nr:hypothetical protein HDU86_004265 [Geranomyces michiganensis]
MSTLAFPQQAFPPFPPYATYQPAAPLPLNQSTPAGNNRNAATSATSVSASTLPRRAVADIRPGLRDLNLSVIVIDKQPHRVTSLLRIADESGSVIANIPSEKAYEQFNYGDMLDITNCEARLQRGRMEVFLNPKLAKCEKYSE